MKEDIVSPGCTRPEIIITSLLFAFPTVIRGMLLPSKLVPKLETLTLGLSWQRKALSLWRL